MSDTTPKEREIAELEEKLIEDSKRLAEMKRSLPPVQIEDFSLKRTDDNVSLTDLFAGMCDLVVIHNMGRNCRYCTMWADGLNGLRHHLQSRAGLVLVSPDAPDVLEEFAAGRGWEFPIASAHGTGFNAAVGMEKQGGALPGVPTFHRGPEGEILKVATEHFGPFDLYCGVWHIFARLQNGVDRWEPQYSYE